MSKNIASNPILIAEEQEEDYQELLKCVIMFLVGVPHKGISVGGPAGISCIMNCKSNLLKLKEMTEICVFVVIIYVICCCGNFNTK